MGSCDCAPDPVHAAAGDQRQFTSRRTQPGRSGLGFHGARLAAALTASERGECRRGEFLPAQGGWSLLIDFARHGLAGAEASRRLLAEGVAATSMENWGLEDTARYLRLVIANEPLERLQGVGARFARAFGEAGGSQT
jgi:DNA-binding transcriptional MocR family regulator